MMAITLAGEALLFEKLDAAIEAVGSPREALEDVGQVVLNEVKMNFEDEGARLESTRWRALTPETIMDRIRHGFSARPILQRTGELKRSFFADANNEQVRISSNNPYYPYHQLGMGYNPKRRMLVLTSDVRLAIIHAFNRFINKALSGDKNL